jgi:hypothetical protein
MFEFIVSWVTKKFDTRDSEEQFGIACRMFDLAQRDLERWEGRPMQDLFDCAHRDLGKLV